jgi:hypothetical protein
MDKANNAFLVLNKFMSFSSYFKESINLPSEEDVAIIKKFVEKRQAGAAKIADQAAAKGGYSSLTAAHFAAKHKPYSICLKHADSPDVIHEHISELLQKIKSWENMTQMEFQKIMGQLEAYGEVALQINKPKTY